MRHTAGPSFRTPEETTPYVQLDPGALAMATWGDWVEVLANTDFITTLLGVSFYTSGSGGAVYELQFGIGDSDVEELGGTNQGIFTVPVANGANGGPQSYDFGVPISAIPANSKLWMRQRQDAGISLYVGLRYTYEADDYALDYNQSPIQTLPLGTAGATLTPNGTEWAYSDPVLLTPEGGLSDPIGISAIVLPRIGFTPYTFAYDIELLIWAGTELEEVIWAQASWNRYGVAAREPAIDILTSLRYVPANTPIYARIRKTGTATTDWAIKLNYYGPISFDESDPTPPAVTKLIVRKVTDGDSDQEFTFRAPGLSPDVFTLRGGESQEFSGIAPGTYAISEDSVDGWSTEASTSTNDPVDAIVVGEGQTVVATFTNTEDNPDIGTPDEDQPDFSDFCIDYSLRLWNQALSRIGISQQVTLEQLEAVLDEDDTQTEYARTAVLHIKEDVEMTLRDRPWEFATKFAVLTRLSGSESVGATPEWQYIYRQPSDCIFERRIVQPARGRTPNPETPPMRLSTNSSGTHIIYTNEPNAYLEYTARGICPSFEGDPLFKEALIWRFAASAAPPHTRMDDVRKTCLEMYERTLLKFDEQKRLGSPSPKLAALVDDTTANGLTADVRVINRALVSIGARPIVNEEDQSREAITAFQIFEQELRTVLRAFVWPFATRYATLELFDGADDEYANYANPDWPFAYRLPDDCVFARRLVVEGTELRHDDEPPPFRVGTVLDADTDETIPVLWTRLDAEDNDVNLEYTARFDGLVLHSDPLFQDAFRWWLAFVLAPALAQIDPEETEQLGRGPDTRFNPRERSEPRKATLTATRHRMAQYALAMYLRALPQAESRHGRERQEEPDPLPPWLRSR